jgi:hypothetical protein
MRAHFTAALICIAAAMSSAHAALVESSFLASPGGNLDLSLFLDKAWPLGPGEVIDQIDITLGLDPSALEFIGAEVHPGGPLDAPCQQVPSACFPDVITSVSFFESQKLFGPGALIDYHFHVLPAPSSFMTTISVDVVASMGGDSVPVTDIAPSSLKLVQSVPEPSSPLMVVVGLLSLGLARIRALRL